MNHDVSKPTKRPIRVLIVDDHVMVRDGLKVMLASFRQQLHFKITEADSGENAIRKLERMIFDLVIIDYQMPGLSGAETVERIIRLKSAVKILALSNYDELPYIQRMMDAGVSGFVLKNIEAAEMLNAIKSILSGRLYYCSEVAVKLIDSGMDKPESPVQVKSLLTGRELEILQMIYMEMTNDEIANQLSVAKRTIDTHRQNMINKLRVKNTAGLIKVAIKLKLVTVE
jgi:DNA-binding NarL/FixJ family response regulator